MNAELREQIKPFMSEHRYLHTLSVADTAISMAKYLLPECQQDAECAALLHDIAKELPLDEQKALAQEYGYELTKSDVSSPQVIHSYAAPALIKRHFPEYAKSEILSAVFNHTTGGDNMSLLDEIIFVADFIEETRPYEASKAARKQFFDAVNAASSYSECLLALHEAALALIKSTIKHIQNRGGYVNERTLDAKSFISEQARHVRENGESDGKY